MALNISSKRVQIDKANLRIVVVVSVAAFVTVFSLVASRALLSQRAYQARVITKKQAAKDVLVKDIKAADELVTSYQRFVAQPTNIIGGSTSGSGDRDGDNAKIVLDALPSKYDFPALAVSMDKIFTDNNFSSSGLSGTDDEIAQSAIAASATPQQVEIPFSLSITTDYGRLPALFGVFERNIRPLNISTLSLTGRDTQLTVSVTGKTYYQPEKAFEITQEVVK